MPNSIDSAPSSKKLSRMAHLLATFARLIFESDAKDLLAQCDAVGQCAFRFWHDYDIDPFVLADYRLAICSVDVNHDMHSHHQAKNAIAANYFDPRHDFHMDVKAIGQARFDLNNKIEKAVVVILNNARNAHNTYTSTHLFLGERSSARMPAL